MLASITPLGERGRQRNWLPTAVAYAIGSVLGGAATGAVFGLIGTPLGTTLGPAAGWILFAGFIVAALLVSTASGLISGVAPARRAARLDPVEALRAE